MTKIIFVSDFFANEVRGGAELCNDALIKRLEERYEVEKIKSANVTPELILKSIGKLFIVANFFMLSEVLKGVLVKKSEYIILEHDHKYIKSNNPALFPDFLAPETQIINKDFYAGALAVMCQSKKHASVVQKNLLLNNIISLSGNLWTEGQLDVLEFHMEDKKTISHAVLNSQNKNKGMHAAIDFCIQTGIKYELLNSQPFESYMANLAQIETLIFFPQWLETYSRLAVEARILGCKLVTNSMLGVASEDYFELKGRDLLEFIRANNNVLMKKWFDLIEGRDVKYFDPVTLPKITVFCPIYKSKEHLTGFLEDMANQTIFDQCELIIINANSPDKDFEIKTINDFAKTHKNVRHIMLDYRATVMETENMALKSSTGEFFAQACVDDRHSPDYLETMAKHLHFTPEVDLVYADCFQTMRPNETFAENTSDGAFYEHSKNKFSKENMIKCLPGPMPMWRKGVHKETGYFSEQLAHAGDWEMFLRMVEAGSRFKKIDVPLGLYYYNSEGLSTSPELAERRTTEEAGVFYAFRHIFGEKTYNQYEPYFRQFKGE